MTVSAMVQALVVDGGELVEVNAVGTEGRIWSLTVRPYSRDDVDVALPAAAGCEAPGAVCTGDGRVLSAAATLTVAGPADVP